MNAVKPALVALATGLGAALALIPATGPVNWRLILVAAAQATLAALGVGEYVRRRG